MKHIISYPRSGAHMVNCTLELITGHKRGFRPGRANVLIEPVSLLKSPLSEGIKWVQSHDPDCKPTPTEYAFLTRDPVDTLHSYMSARGIVAPAVIDQFAGEWAWHKYRWTELQRPTLFIQYEDVLFYPNNSYAHLLKFIGLSQAMDIDKCVNLVTHKALAEASKSLDQRSGRKMSNYLNEKLSSGEYNRSRITFREKYSTMIWRTINRVMADQNY